VVELHAYALVGQPDDQELRDQLLAQLHHVYPELLAARIFAEKWLIKDDCPLWSTDPWQQRPTVQTPPDRACRRHPLPLPGRTHGAQCYDRLPGRQRVSLYIETGWP
jgi:hypothetical protein